MTDPLPDKEQFCNHQVVSRYPHFSSSHKLVHLHDSMYYHEISSSISHLARNANTRLRR